jgi:ribosomal protein S18 acetylase RimI-like enzyme
MIKFISTEDTLTVRSLVLREGLDSELCRFEGDDDGFSFHLGYFKDGILVCVASFHQQGRESFNGKGYQLRGMATLPAYQGTGIGNQLVNFSIVYLRGQKANYLWCNARKVAFRFYTGLGFEFISEEFDIPGIGKHKAMYLKIQ